MSLVSGVPAASAPPSSGGHRASFCVHSQPCVLLNCRLATVHIQSNHDTFCALSVPLCPCVRPVLSQENNSCEGTLCMMEVTHQNKELDSETHCGPQDPLYSYSFIESVFLFYRKMGFKYSRISIKGM